MYFKLPLASSTSAQNYFSTLTRIIIFQAVVLEYKLIVKQKDNVKKVKTLQAQRVCLVRWMILPKI